MTYVDFLFDDSRDGKIGRDLTNKLMHLLKNGGLS